VVSNRQRGLQWELTKGSRVTPNRTKSAIGADIFDLGHHLAQGESVERTAEFLMRRVDEVQAKMRELRIEPVALR